MNISDQIGKAYENKHKRPMKNINIVVIGVCDILEGLGRVLSLGYAQPDLSDTYDEWAYRLMVNYRHKVQSEQERKNYTEIRKRSAELDMAAGIQTRSREKK